MVERAPAGARTSRDEAEGLTARLFAELRLPLARYLVSLGTAPADAEELIQETFVRLHQHVSAARPAGNLRGWAFRVAHNLAESERIRRGRQGAEALPPFCEKAALGPSPEERVLRAERLRRLAEALRRLPPPQRYSIHLRAEGLKYREIAEVLGVAVSTVAEYLRQALESLAKETS